MNIRIGIPGPDSLGHITQGICTSLSLNCTLIPYNGSQFGDADENGTGSGMIGLVQRGEFDPFQPVFTPTYTRFRAIDFSDPYFYSDIILATRANNENGDKLSFKLVLALKWQTWLVFMGALVFTAVFISVTRKAISSSLGIPNMEYTVHWMEELMEPLPGLLTHKHKGKYIQYHFVRFVITCWSLAIIVLTSAYTGLLFSEKVKDPNELPYKDMDTFVDCLVADKCGIIAQTTSASQIQALTRDESIRAQKVRSALARREIRVANIEDIPQIILAESDLRLVWIEDKVLFDYYAANNSECKFYVIEGFKEVWSFPVRKHSQLKPILDRGAAAFQENGLAQAEFLDHQSSGGSCNYQQTGFRKTIERDTFTSIINAACCFFAFGIGGAIVSFVIEKLVKTLGGIGRQNIG